MKTQFQYKGHEVSVYKSERTAEYVIRIDRMAVDCGRSFESLEDLSQAAKELIQRGRQAMKEHL